MARVNPVKQNVDFGADGVHENASFDSATALDMRQTVTEKIGSRVAKPGIKFRGNGLHWYEDQDLGRDAEMTLLIAAGIPVFVPAIPDDPPDPQAAKAEEEQ